ncbi:hypothetical protein COB52_01760 [Candidatus Kaiserbacteria bacterium]|nr:MAG: hypothetical protein COB52_01760 [Candidatus Kaiserbacteria bacterium]
MRYQKKLTCIALFLLTLSGLFLMLHLFLNLPSYNGDGLSRYRVLALQDPVLSLPSTDLKSLDTGIEALSDSIRLYSKYYGEDRTRVENYLYPTNFLETLSFTESARQKLIHSERVTYKDALKYHKALQFSLKQYKVDIQNTINQLSSFGDINLGFLNGITSTDFLVQQLLVAKNNASEKQLLDNLRFDCIKNDHLRCGQPDLGGKNVEVRDLTPGDQAVSPEVFQYNQVVNDIESISVDQQNPLVIHVETYCYGEGDSLIAYKVWERPSRISGIPVVEQTIINDIFLKKAPANSTDEYLAGLSEDGLSLALHYVSPYFCTDYGLDAGINQTSIELVRLLRKTPVFSTIISGPFEKIAFLERNVLNNNSTIDVEQLNEYVRFLETELEENEILLQMDLGEDLVRTMYEYITLWNSKSADFDLSIGLLEDTAFTNIKVLANIKIPVAPLFMTRGYLSTVFLLNNTTLHTQPISLIHKKFDTENYIDNFSILSYKNNVELQKEIPLEELAQTIIKERSKSRLLLIEEYPSLYIYK